jgi:hypothetical protein
VKYRENVVKNKSSFGQELRSPGMRRKQTQRKAWGERGINQYDATNPMFIIKHVSQHGSGIIMSIIRRTRPCITAYGLYAIIHGLVS